MILLYQMHKGADNRAKKNKKQYAPLCLCYNKVRLKDVPEGSWFGSMRVENDAVWQKIKEDDGYMLKGFSVEGIFKEDKEMTMDQEVIDAVIDSIQQ